MIFVAFISFIDDYVIINLMFYVIILRNYQGGKPSCVWSDDPWCEDDIEYESFGKFDL